MDKKEMLKKEILKLQEKLKRYEANIKKEEVEIEDDEDEEEVEEEKVSMENFNKLIRVVEAMSVELDTLKKEDSISQKDKLANDNYNMNYKDLDAARQKRIDQTIEEGDAFDENVKKEEVQSEEPKKEEEKDEPKKEDVPQEEQPDNSRPQGVPPEPNPADNPATPTEEQPKKEEASVEEKPVMDEDEEKKDDEAPKAPIVEKIDLKKALRIESTFNKKGMKEALTKLKLN